MVPASLDRRQQLLDGLEAIFLKEGFRDVTIEDLAGRLRCSRRTLYQIAPSKPEIFLVVLDRFLARIREEGREAAYSRSEPMGRIEALLEPGITATLPASPRFTEDVDGYQPARTMLAEHQRERMRVLRELVEDGISRGAFKGFHALLVAEVMVAATGCVSRHEFLREAGLSMSEAFAECSRLLRLGLASPAQRNEA